MHNRPKRHQLNEILFDEHARRDFLTGFHKRKVAKTDAARKKAQDRQKQDRLEARREKRRALREQAAENARQAEIAFGSTYDNEEEWSGISSALKGKQRDQEYENDQLLATVTVVEDFDPDTIRHGPLDEPSSPSLSARKSKSTPRSEVAPESKNHHKPKKIRYQTKEARKAERSKQFARRKEKAEHAGGKASRKKSRK